MGFKPRIASSAIHVVRVYDIDAIKRGPRYLVDRVWPRGVRRDSLALTAWLPDVGPSTALRQWFGHEPSRWPEFVLRYHAELAASPETWEPLARALRAGPITLLYSARDRVHNQAIALRNSGRPSVSG